MDVSKNGRFVAIFVAMGSGARIALLLFMSSAMSSVEYGNIYQQGFDSTVRFLMSKGVAPQTAEEMAQAAWTRGWERIAQLRERAWLQTWVNAIALNMYRRSSVLDSKQEPLEDHPGGIGVNVAAIDLSILLGSCRLSDRVLLTHQLHGFTTVEIAGAIGTTESAVRLRLVRARRSARSILFSKGESRGRVESSGMNL